MKLNISKASSAASVANNDIGAPRQGADLRSPQSLARALPGLLLVGLPTGAIVAVLSGSIPYELGHNHLLHELMVAMATLFGGLFTFTAYRGFRADRSVFRYYLALAFLAETILYGLHGVFTRWSDSEPLLFLLYGPASRLAMAALLLAAVLKLRTGAKLAPGKTRLALWILANVVIAACIAAFALLGLQETLSVSMRVTLELLAFLVLAAAGSVLIQTTWWVAFALVRSLMAALMLFIMASLAFLLVKSPWDSMFWLAHGTFATGFLILGFSVLRARRQVLSMGDVFDLEVLATRLRNQESALVHQESLQRIAAGIAHHVNNLMTVVIGNSENLAACAVDRSPEKSMAEDCLRAGERAAELSRRLATCAGQAILTPSSVPLGQFLEDVARRWGEERGHPISLKIEHGAGGTMVHADSDLLCEAVLALLDNGRDALGGGGELRLVSMLGDGDPGPDFAGIAVVDRGSGMNEHVMARAREPFFSTGNMAERSGLGLSIAEGVANSLGGSVTLQSRLGEGTTATIWVPVSR